MQEVLRLLNAIDTATAQHKDAAIATVVRVKGSAYRREGTKMLIDADGKQTCMISGGCLEQEVAEVAKRVMDSKQPVVKAFDLDEDLVWGLGLGCGGSVDVYIEPFDDGDANKKFLAAVRAQQPACLATIITSDTPALPRGARLFIDASSTSGTLGAASLDERFTKEARSMMQQLYPRAKTVRINAHNIDVFLDVTMPAPELSIFGAGHDAIPLANYAHTLGFNTTIIDARHAFVTPGRFPHAKQLIRTHPSGFANTVTLSARSYVIIMNHHLERDKDSLAFALNSQAPYIGVLGPRSRYEQILDMLKDDGHTVHPDALKRVRNPIGVDIGADTPEEIAMSILSELIALRGNYPAGFLSARTGPIHTDRQQTPTLTDEQSTPY